MNRVKGIAAAMALVIGAGSFHAQVCYAAESIPTLSKIGSYVSGTSNKDGGVCEIISYDNKNNKAWVVNGATGMMDILSLSEVTCAVTDKMESQTLNVKELVEGKVSGFTYGDMTSVSVNSDLGIAAVALQAADHDKNGYVALFSTDGTFLTMMEAGCQPDMVTFTPDGKNILVANEGEPREGYGDSVTDPAGSVTVITVNEKNPAESKAVTVGFEKYDAERDALLAQGVIMTKGALPSADFEPEYIAATDSVAYVALQEANAIAVLDLETKEFTGVYSLGYKDLSLEENAIDLLSDEVYVAKTYTDAVAAYMPDGISLYTENGTTYLLTANEGDAREWGSDETEFCNEVKETLTATDGTEAKKVRVLDEEVTDGLPEGKKVLFGGRSFSIYKVAENGLTRVYDSGNQFEAKTSELFPEYFNCSNDDNEYDSRSQKKGPEPESVTVGMVEGKAYAFVALERIGGIMMYDITDPSNAVYANYINTRDFTENPENADSKDNPEFYLTGDVAPEGLYFISAEKSVSNTPILLAAFEVSGTVAAYSVGEVPAGHQYGADGICGLCGNYDADYDANISQEENGTSDEDDFQEDSQENYQEENGTSEKDEFQEDSQEDSQEENGTSDEDDSQTGGNSQTGDDSQTGNDSQAEEGSGQENATQITAPKTGDNREIFYLWAAVLFFAMGATGLALYIRNRR